MGIIKMSVSAQDNKQTDKVKKPFEWHPQQAKLLKGWGEVASSYRWMHNQAYMIYKKKNLRFMLPLIIMSTVAGTANFAQSTFPETVRPYVPQIIGAMNLVSAIMTTIYQFLKISEFMESHRISSINYGKLARTITVELNLPIKDRNSGGAECVKVSRTEIDRLIEQSPVIPKSVLLNYELQFAGRGLSEPEIVVINPVDIYEDIENKTAVTVAEAGLKMKQLIKKPFLVNNASTSPTVRKKEQISNELNSLKSNRFVTLMSELSSKLPGSPKKQISLPVFEEIPQEKYQEIPQEKYQDITQHVTPVVSKYFTPVVSKYVTPVLPEPEPEPEPEPKPVRLSTSESEKIINETVDDLINEVVDSTESISNDLELLRSSRLVSSKKNGN